MLWRRGDEAGDETLHAAIVGTLPIKPVAYGAGPEFVEVLSGFGLKTIADELLGNRTQQDVAMHAAFERHNGTEQAKVLKDFRKLAARFGGSDAVAPGDDVAFQEPAVAGEKNAVFVCRDAGEILVRVVAVVGGVESHHA